MSKVWKGIKKGVKKVGNFVKKYWKEIVIAAAVVFTAGVATVGFAGMSAAYGAATASGMGAFKAALYVGGSTIWAGATSIAGTVGIGGGASGFVATEAGMSGATLLTGAAAQSIGMAAKGGSLVPGAGANTGTYTGWGAKTIGSEGALFGDLGVSKAAAPTGNAVTSASGTTTTAPSTTVPASNGGIMNPNSPNFVQPGGGGIMDPASSNFMAPTTPKPTWSMDPATGTYGPTTANNLMAPAAPTAPTVNTSGGGGGGGGTPSAPKSFWNTLGGQALLQGGMGMAQGYMRGMAMEDYTPIAQWGVNMNGKTPNYVLPGMINPTTGKTYTPAEVEHINVTSRAAAEANNRRGG